MNIMNCIRVFARNNCLNDALRQRALIHQTPATYLFAPAAIGVGNYLDTRKRVQTHFADYSEKFKTKMQEFTNNDSKNMIFTEDLKNMVHIATKEDINLVVQMISKFSAQNGEHRFGSFVFGPVVMRMFHYLDEPKVALKCFEDLQNDKFFDQHVSYQILLDLLYRHKMYDDMRRVFAYIQEKQVQMTKHPKYVVILMMAACYKQNTKDSFEYASKLMSDMNSTGSVPLRRSCCFFAALALNQGAPHIALEIISPLKQNYYTIRNIKATALADMGRVDDALPILRSVLNIDSPSEQNKHTFLQETVNRVREAVTKSGNTQIQKEYESIQKELKERNLIDEKTLDELLCQEIQAVRSPQDQRQVRLHASYQGERERRPQYGQRQNYDY